MRTKPALYHGLHNYAYFDSVKMNGPLGAAFGFDEIQRLFNIFNRVSNTHESE